jgi:hypothetical protein
MAETDYRTAFGSSTQVDRIAGEALARFSELQTKVANLMS